MSETFLRHFLEVGDDGFAEGANIEGFFGVVPMLLIKSEGFIVFALEEEGVGKVALRPSTDCRI